MFVVLYERFCGKNEYSCWWLSNFHLFLLDFRVLNLFCNYLQRYYFPFHCFSEMKFLIPLNFFLVQIFKVHIQLPTKILQNPYSCRSSINRKSSCQPPGTNPLQPLLNVLFYSIKLFPTFFLFIFLVQLVKRTIYVKRNGNKLLLDVTTHIEQTRRILQHILEKIPTNTGTEFIQDHGQFLLLARKKKHKKLVIDFWAPLSSFLPLGFMSYVLVPHETSQPRFAVVCVLC